MRLGTNENASDCKSAYLGTFMGFLEFALNLFHFLFLETFAYIRLTMPLNSTTQVLVKL